MRYPGRTLLLGGLLFTSISVPAQDQAYGQAKAQAVDIAIGSQSGTPDKTVLHSVRKLVGDAISNDTIDTFYIYIPRPGSPNSMESGLSACAEAGFIAAEGTFDELLRRLRSLPARPGTSIRVELTDRCAPLEPIEPVECGGLLGILCPATQYCEKITGQCKTPDAQGTCKAAPAACEKKYEPVCGCDGETYDNPCEASAQGYRSITMASANLRKSWQYDRARRCCFISRIPCLSATSKNPRLRPPPGIARIRPA